MHESIRSCKFLKIPSLADGWLSVRSEALIFGRNICRPVSERFWHFGTSKIIPTENRTITSAARRHRARHERVRWVQSVLLNDERNQPCAYALDPQPWRERS